MNGVLANWSSDPKPNQRILRALQTLNDASGELRTLRMEHSKAVSEARLAVSHDPNLSAEGRANALLERTAAVGERFMRSLTELKDNVDSAYSTIVRTIEKSWPTPAAGVEGMLGRQAAWARSRSLLDGGIRPGQVIEETTDVETLFALREELPTWLRSKGADLSAAEAATHHIDAQISRVASDPSIVDLSAKFEARTILAALQPMLDHTEAEFTGRGTPAAGIHAAVAAQLARQSPIGTRIAYEV
ncbi:hypothetical protein [Crossiella sp. CA198]|uniref:hypothetical protein n=1 Tax=Crossiella sp. CA198 TaxID=3455607 RepID=UPI003F8D0113